MKNKQHEYILKAFLESSIPTVMRRSSPELMAIDSIIGGIVLGGGRKVDIEKLLHDNGEIEFDYKGRHYFLACYCIKRVLKKGHVEYWLMAHLEGNQERQVFDTIDDLLDANIEGEKLKSILDSIEIIE